MIGPDTWKMKQLGGIMSLYEHRYKYGKQKSIMSVEEFKARANQGDFDETFTSPSTSITRRLEPKLAT
jgi:hypothetical protein